MPMVRPWDEPFTGTSYIGAVIVATGHLTIDESLAVGQSITVGEA